MSSPADVPVRPAATVVVLRDGADGLEVWLQQRAATLAFAAGMYAFPGGAVDPEDATTPLPGSDVESQSRIWGDLDENVTRSHLAAAVRETLEESGLVLDPTALRPWSRWLTPVGEVRRFDARFYVAPCPGDQTPQPLTGEVAAGGWFLVRAAVDNHAVGTLPMWPPTITTLLQLVPFDHVAAVLQAAPNHVVKVTS